MPRPPLPERFGILTETSADAASNAPIPRRPVWLRRAVCVLLSAVLLHCDSPLAEEPEAIEPPVYDREAHDAVIDMRGRSFRATLTAPRLLDFEDERQTRADSGVVIVLLDSSGESMTRLTAERMSLDRRADRLGPRCYP